MLNSPPDYSIWNRHQRIRPFSSNQRFGQSPDHPQSMMFEHPEGTTHVKVTHKKLKDPKTKRDLVQRFVDTTSLQGVASIHAATKWYAKLLWIFIFLCATGVWIAHSTILIMKYIEFDTNSHVKITFSPIEYPTLTFCNMNPIRNSKVDNSTINIWRILYAMKHGKVYNASKTTTRNKRQIDNMESSYEDQNDHDLSNEYSSGNSYSDEYYDEYYYDEYDDDEEYSWIPDDWDDYDYYDELYDFDYSDYYEDEENYDDGDYTDFELKKGDFSQFTGFDEMLEKNYNNRHILKHILRQAISLKTNKKRREMGHHISDMLLGCTFDGVPCSSNNFTQFLDYAYGNCFSLNSAEVFEQPIHSNKSGAFYGLSLVLHVEHDEYLQGLNPGRGVRLLIHPFKTQPFVEQSGISISTGYQTYIGIRNIKQTKLGGVYGNCDDGGAYKAYYKNYTYTLDGCYQTCYVRTVSTECQCIASNETRPLYNEADRKTFKSCDTKDGSKCANAVLKRMEDENCGCAQACQTLDYDLLISQDQWPEVTSWQYMMRDMCKHTDSSKTSHSKLERLSKNTTPTEPKRSKEEDTKQAVSCTRMKEITKLFSGDKENITFKMMKEDFLQKNVMHIKIFFRDLNIETIKEVPSYPDIQFYSDMGGVIGLWLGASVLTIFELLDFLCRAIQFCAKQETYSKRKLRMHMREERMKMNELMMNTQLNPVFYYQTSPDSNSNGASYAYSPHIFFTPGNEGA